VSFLERPRNGAAWRPVKPGSDAAETRLRADPAQTNELGDKLDFILRHGLKRRATLSTPWAELRAMVQRG
jgi:hypothetical protein